MSKIKEAFAHGKAFIPFITCGDPDLETTYRCVRACVENGAGLIELGIPFSDPTSGPSPAASPPIKFSSWCGTCAGT